MRHAQPTPSCPAGRLPGAAGPVLKVPFGLREGRLFNPKQVAPGKACDCTCPGCGARLVAKAAASTCRHPHFAHLGGSKCQGGYESALHLKAKQVLAASDWLTLPAWDGEPDMPNPPELTDDSGVVWAGRRVEFPVRKAAIAEVRLEVPLGDYVPDAACLDLERGEDILVEIKVSHAVDAIKEARLRADDCRCFEIDLADLDSGILLDDALLKAAVLFEPSNRTWVSCSEATEAWRASLRDLKSFVAERNRELAEERAQKARAAEEAANLAAAGALAAQAQRDRRQAFLLQQRAPHLARLERLPGLVDPANVELLLQTYCERDGIEAENLLAQVEDDELRQALRYCAPNAWIYTVHPSLWQAAAYHHFIAARAPDAHVCGRDVARWVMHEFGREEDLWELFRVQYEFRAKARNAGYAKNRISFWAFTDLENQQIPNFYKPINTFLDRLVYVHTLVPLRDKLGEFKISADCGSIRMAGDAGTQRNCRSDPKPV